MEKILHRLPQGLLLILILISSACKREKLAEVWSTEPFPAVSMGLNNRLEIGAGSKFTLTGGQLIVPVTINFSAPTSRAFIVNLSSNTDTIANLISAGLLDQETVAIEPDGFSIPSNLNIPIGVTSFTFDMNVARTFVEKHYRKEIAVGLKLIEASKGNTVSSANNSIIVLIKTGETIAAEDVHYISFGSKDFKFPVPAEGNYEIGSSSIVVSVPIVLGGLAGPAFNVAISNSPDVITQLVSEGKLSNVQVVPTDAFSISPTVRFGDNVNTATLSFEINRNKLLAIKNKTAVIALKLSNPEKYQLDEDKKTVVIMFDQDFFRPYFGTPFVIKGAIGAVSDPIYASYFDFGGLDVAYKDDLTKNGVLTHRPDEWVDIEENLPFTAVGFIVTGEWLTFSVLVEETGTYEMLIQAGSPNTAARYSVLFGDVNLAGTLSVVNTGGYAIYKDHFTTVKLTKGRHIMRVNFVNTGLNYKGVIFTRKS